MKNIIAAGFLTLTMLSCNQKEITIIKTNSDSIVNKKENFAVDSVSVNDSIKINDKISAAFGSTVLVFPTLNNKTLLDSIYSKENLKLESYTKESLQKALQDKMQQYFTENKKSSQDYPGDFQQTWNQNSKMKIFSKDDNFMTLQYTGDGFSGGAHGYYYEFYKNFNIKSAKTLQLSDVLNTTDSKTWDPILMKAFLRNKDYTIDLLFDKRVPLNDNFYFDDKSIHFVYGQYEIAPYAAGIINIEVPFSTISNYLSPEFKTVHSVK